MKLTRASFKAIKYACLHFHYAKTVPLNTIGYNVFNDDDEWCGVVLFGAGANKAIGTSYNLKQGQALELVRVALNGKQLCTSQCVASALKQLHKDCPLCRLVVSYADCDQKHLGTIYQATNWIYVGQVNENDISAFMIHTEKGIRKVHRKNIYAKIIVKDGRKMHCPQTLDAVRKYIDPKAEYYRTEGKRKYLMPMDKKMRKQIEHLKQPYPKIDNDWKKIDREQFHRET